MGHRLILLLMLIGTMNATYAQEPSSYKVETLASDLNFPWSIAFLPDGAALVTELVGQVRILGADQSLSAPLSGVPEVFRAGQGGLFDVILDPNFTTNNTLYLSYASGDAQANATTVARAVLSDTRLTEVEVIYTAQPEKYAPLHYGGRLAWLPGGDLLLTTGDGFDFREKAQATGNHFGKTIRIPIANANPSPLPEAPLVWSYGHRNPQGLAVSKDGSVFLHEHGPKGGDELNIIRPGENYGWPAVTHGEDYNGAFVSPFKTHPSMQDPIHTWVPSIAPSGLMVYEGAQFPEWQGDLFLGALVDQEVRHLDMEDGTVIGEQMVFPEIKARIRDIREGPGGSIYVLTDGAAGEVIRISNNQ